MCQNITICYCYVLNTFMSKNRSCDSLHLSSVKITPFRDFYNILKIYEILLCGITVSGFEKIGTGNSVKILEGEG